MSDLFDGDKPMFTPLQRKNLREQLSKALAHVDTDGPPTRWQDVYIPPSHVQALDPQRMVVEGMRGAGKSFWTGVLTTPDFLSSLGAQEIGLELKSSLPKIHQSHRIALDTPNLQERAKVFPQASELDRLLQWPGVKPETIWAVAILRLFPHDPEFGMPQPDDAYDGLCCINKASAVDLLEFLMNFRI